MYVTAGLGPTATNEEFTSPYDLPNETAYAETCASVALIFWAKRMLDLDCDSTYERYVLQSFHCSISNAIWPVARWRALFRCQSTGK